MIKVPFNLICILREFLNLKRAIRYLMVSGNSLTVDVLYLFFTNATGTSFTLRLLITLRAIIFCYPKTSADLLLKEE